MRRGQHGDVVAKPARKTRPPTLAELAARVKWLEECQKANVETVDALRAQVTTLTEQVTGYAARVKVWTDWANKRFLGDSLATADEPARASKRPRRYDRMLVVVTVWFVVAVVVAVGLAWLGAKQPVH